MLLGPKRRELALKTLDLGESIEDKRGREDGFNRVYFLILFYLIDY